jgi:hypothetical protein
VIGVATSGARRMSLAAPVLAELALARASLPAAPERSPSASPPLTFARSPVAFACGIPSVG